MSIADVDELPQELRAELAPLFWECMTHTRELNEVAPTELFDVESLEGGGLATLLEAMKGQVVVARKALATQEALTDSATRVIAVLERHLGQTEQSAVA